MPYAFQYALTATPRSLETFTLRAGFHQHSRIDDADLIVLGLSNDQAGSLHTWMFNGLYTGQTIQGHGCSIYRNEELERAINLKTVAINISDLEPDCHDCASDENDEHTTEEESRAYFIKYFRKAAFPPLIERIVFWGLVNESHVTKCKGKFLEWLEDALIDVVQSPPSIEEVDDPSMDGGSGRKSSRGIRRAFRCYRV
ncbi:hypothetical protein P171DRAFT_519063 [Karstenula rhodostoma CBS 690.94]|uniref:Uncharacterized protein n=1 Tax=Karstenula rhodostoma CBS 690.94 TaxID=1392251 RepID=A0A9P4PPL8_9PLEO|nr:hypothetical protein P171DRAFT_519063 [Karstenula rhodostoma CBS 690.94]